ncbi:MAG: hypothetical protein NCW75_05565 [Phycisphaera sp.]|nr:MAG: hypothetical protein NCW75_05565 [Phycisphaera sp.]
MGKLIALGGTLATGTPLMFAGKRSYVLPGVFIQSFASGLKKGGEPTSGGEYLPEKLETTASPTPLGEGDTPVPYPNLPVVEFEGTTYRMTQAAAVAWEAQITARMSSQAIAEGWYIQDDFEWRTPLLRLASTWIGEGTGSIFPEEDSPAYDTMMAAWTRGKQHVANTKYPNNPYGNYALGWPRPLLNPTGLSQRRGLPTAAEITFIKQHYWDPQQTHYVHGHFKPGDDPTLATPAKFREAHRLWASSEKARLTAEGVPQDQWTMSIWLPFFSRDDDADFDPATGMSFIRAGLEGIAEAQWPSVDIGGLENTDTAAMGFSSTAEFVDQLLVAADETVFVDGLPGPSSTFQPTAPVAGQPEPGMPGDPTPLKAEQTVQLKQTASWILRKGVSAKYFRGGEGPGVDIVVYVSDSAPRTTGGSPERSRDSLNSRKRQSWQLICLAGTHLVDPGLGVAGDPDLEAIELDPRSVVRLQHQDTFEIQGVHLGRDANETIKLRVPEKPMLVNRLYWSVEVSA